MKFEVGDQVTIKITNEDAKVVDILNEKMVMIEVKGVKFPAYTDQLDYPYLKMFTKQRQEEKKKTIYIDQVKVEKKPITAKVEEGVFIAFVPVFDKDVFDDDIVEKLKVYLINQTSRGYRFSYKLHFNKAAGFELDNEVEPMHDFYLHDVPFDDLSDSPRFDFEFSLSRPEKGKAPYFETSLKLKGKQLFKKIEELQQNNQATFKYVLFDQYPAKAEEIAPPSGLDLSHLGNAGFRVYDAAKIRQNLPAARTVVDLHIEKLMDRWQHLTNFEILSVQLSEFEKYYDLAIHNFQPSLTIVHGVGSGKLKDEIHQILRGKKEVKSFVNQYMAAFGYGATEIFFQY